MIDREKVIKGLEETEIMLKQAVDRGGEMAVMGAFKCYNHVSDALSLLKEREPVKPVDQGDGSYICDNCGETVGWEELDVFGIDPVKYKYCPGCGRKVKWDDRV